MYLILDTETTGLSQQKHATAGNYKSWPRLVQIAWILADDKGDVVEEYCEVIKPVGFVISNESERIHGISNEHASLYGIEVGQALEAIERRAKEANVLVAHNIGFDVGIVRSEFFRMTGNAGFPYRLNCCCTMHEGALMRNRLRLSRGSKWPTLSVLYSQLFDCELLSAHNALTDVRACTRIYFKMKSLGYFR